ncbi:MAG TPA: hypothetical protein VMT89_01165, partial [Candidatus Acidoferrales bacterium]|nr:hypothetical protein [Candidatus Acidoferrales bacterium]
AVNWPWALAHGTRALPAAQGGDAVLAKGWQKQGIHQQAGRIRESHPWTRSVVNYGWPNPGSVRRVRKTDKAPRLIGSLRRRVLPLRSEPFLARRGLARPLSRVSSRLLDTLFAAWSTRALASHFEGQVEPLRRFDASFDEVTRRCMVSDGYWSPHDSAFLNWRYFSDPEREYAAFALTTGDVPVGYGVVMLSSENALLMEFVVPPDQPTAARVLLQRLIQAAADAGCSSFAVMASPRWRYWRQLRVAGFIAVRSEIPMYVYSWRDDTPGVQHLDNWQLQGGDLEPFCMSG